jgi:hypothetical protein
MTDYKRQLRERHGGSSQVADWLDGVGSHGQGPRAPAPASAPVTIPTTPEAP